jgi:hypothetical protein
MLPVMKELQKLKGVGEVLSRRFVEAGYDTFAKIAAAGEKGLQKIPGVNPRMLASIVAEAAALSGDIAKNKSQKAAQLKLQVAALKEQVQGIALSVRDRFRDEVAGKSGRKLEKEILKLIDALEKVEGRLETRVKRAGKGLLKAEKKLEGLAMANLKKVGNGLQKARKSLKTISG